MYEVKRNQISFNSEQLSVINKQETMNNEQ